MSDMSPYSQVDDLAQLQLRGPSDAPRSLFQRVLQYQVDIILRCVREESLQLILEYILHYCVLLGDCDGAGGRGLFVEFLVLTVDAGRDGDAELCLGRGLDDESFLAGFVRGLATVLGDVDVAFADEAVALGQVQNAAVGG